MNKAYRKEIWRTIKNSRKRFLSLLLITALGVTVLTGIYAACQDLYYSADRFYDEQNLFDIRIVSTLGLTQDDVEALESIEEIKLAEGAYSETVNTKIDDIDYTAQMSTLSQKGVNVPYIEAGELPLQSGEIAVTREYLDAAGKKLGDTVTIEEDLDTDDDDEAESDTETVTDEKETEQTESDEDTDSEIEEIEWDSEVEIEEDEETPSFLQDTYRITGIVVDPMDISNDAAEVRSSVTAADYTFYITDDDVDSDIYTTIYITLTDMEEVDGFSDEYKERVDFVTKKIENGIKSQREQARYDYVIEDATSIIKDAEDTMNEKFQDADQQFLDAWDEINNAKQELADGEQELTEKEADALQQIADGKTEIKNSKQQLIDSENELLSGEAELNQSRAELESNAQQIADGKQELVTQRQNAESEFAAAEQTLAEKQAQLDDSRANIDAGVNQMKLLLGAGWPQNEWDALVTAAAGNAAEQQSADSEAEVDAQAVAAATVNEQNNLAAAIMSLAADPADYTQLSASCVESAIGLGIVEAGQQVLNAGKATFQETKVAALAQITAAEEELASGEAQLEAGRKQIESAAAQIESGIAQIESGWIQITDAENTLNEEEAKAKTELTDAWTELNDGKQELEENVVKLADNEKEYLEKKEEAEQKIADAYEELEDIDIAEWYVQDRDSIDSYASLKSDLSSIESIGNVFPVLFLVIAILISLTTMTRMIEEERGFIGTYKALGYSNAAIYGKYGIYSALACICGGILGDVLGFIALPQVLLLVLQSLYTLPNVYLTFDWLYGIGGMVLFLVGIVGAAILACRNELKETPAALMRPKAPKGGTRIFLERIPVIWNRLKFLNKVTIRNLFRYKKRFFMTVFGIMGCTALLVAGFGIRDTVEDLLPKQYERIYQYGFMTAVSSDDNDELQEILEEDENIADYVNLQIENMKVLNSEEASESVQLMVIPDGESINSYIQTVNMEGDTVTIDNTGVYLTYNAANLLEVEVGDTVTLQNSNLKARETVVAGIMENYLGNNVYMTQEVYESLFGEFNPNGALAHFTKECSDHVKYTEDFSKQDIVLSAVSLEGLKDGFTDQFGLVNAVVYIIIVLAAGLAFIVLFTLSSTNISERMRELATTKVLGFYDNEVHSYVNKETLILTFIGILIGLPLGRVLSELLTLALKMPSIYFAAHVEPISYVYSAVLAFSFALVVNLITNHSLNKINMVEALKSVE